MTETETPRHQPPSEPPVACGHRGFKAKYPENTLLAFNSTISDANSRIIETDLQISKDEVILINHDLETGRTYDKQYHIQQTNYDPELKNMKNLSPPHESILTFNKLLQWLVKKNLEVGNVKFMLDIKPVNPLKLLDLIVEEMLKVENDISYWHDKIIFGLWAVNFYEYGAVTQKIFDGFEIINITLSMTIAKQFLEKSMELEKTIPNFKAPITGVSLIHIATWGANYDDEFIKFYELLINKLQRKLYLWTCNDLRECDFYLKLGISGFLTDVPDKLNELIANTDRSRQLNLYEFYRYNDPINFHSRQGLKNYGTYKVYKSFEFAVLKGYLSYKVPVINGGKNTIGSYSVGVLKFLGVI